MTTAQKVWYIIEWAGFPPPHGFDELVKSEHAIRGLLLNLNFLKMLFGTSTAGYTTKVVGGAAVKDKPIPMYILAAQELVIAPDYIDRLYTFAKKKHEHDSKTNDQTNAKGN